MNQICKSCGVAKSVSEYWKAPRTLSGYEYTCKKCRMIDRYDKRLLDRKTRGLKVRDMTQRQTQELKEQGLKYCSKCKSILEQKKFSGKSPYCYDCCLDISQDRLVTERERQRRRDQYKKGKASMKNAKLLRSFGITLAQYEAMLVAQNNKCCICGDENFTEGKCLAVDHNHTTNKVRGLLCGSCNAGLGMFKDSTTRLENAIAYLKLTEDKTA